ncbi:VWA domain-containing protein [Ruminiclostridium hungatei]|uniref:VWA domain-containing protein n=1 Tax=Ruminiclostridium hungatei TaxID=48256 RepID=UPI0013FD4ACB|nr:VWA domain-containing protein [Ruminiclostridium hungatei]
MNFKKVFIKQFLALVLIAAILTTSAGLTLCYAEAPEQQPEEAVAKAHAWLETSQNADGSWGDKATAFVDTGELAQYLSDNGVLQEGLEKAIAWLEALVPKNNDMAARALPFVGNAGKHSVLRADLLRSQNKDGGWGIFKGYESDVPDTNLVLGALLKEQAPDLESMKKAVSYLINRQMPDGSWTFTDAGDTTVALVAGTVITLNSFQTKTGLTSPELQTAMRKAGEYLIAVQQEDKTWGMDEAAAADTLLAYRAVLNTLGADAAGNIDSDILRIQNSNGSWYDSPYLTALALEALQERQDMPFAKINSIKLYKVSGDIREEGYSFNAYESFEIQAETSVSNTEAEILYFIKKQDGSIISLQSDGLPGWNTKNSAPGEYSVIVQMKDKASGKIVANQEKRFVIDPYFKIGSVVLTTDPENIRINNPCTVDVKTTLVTESNINKAITFKAWVIDAGAVIEEETGTIECKAPGQIEKFTSITFSPDVSAPKDYIIKTQVFEAETLLAEGETTFSVLPPLPPTRINFEQSAGKTVLYPGEDSVSLQFNLTGEGTPELPQRNPIDMVLCIDDSGSMEWGNIDESTTRPWRIDFAKEASSHVIDLLQANDRGAVVEFAGNVWVQQDITENKDLLKTKIAQTPASPWNGTAIGLGLQSANNILNTNSSQSRTKIIILLSDGVENVWSVSNVINQANLAREKGYKIYTIGLGAGADQNLLSTLASITGGKYVFSPTMEQLDKMMTELAGEIFDTAGKNIALETTLPAGKMTVDASKIVPAPVSVLNGTDGAITLKWTMDRLVMGGMKVFGLDFKGTNLEPETEITLTRDTKLTYLDRNSSLVTLKLPDVKIPVNIYMLDSKVSTDKAGYGAGENVTVTNEAKNLTDYPAALTGRAEILDSSGNLVKVVGEDEHGAWEAGQTRTFAFSWNTGLTMAGTYTVRITWSEGQKVIAAAQASFEIAEAAGASASMTVDREKYTSDEEVYMNETIRNSSVNSILRGLAVRTSIRNAEGDIIWTGDSLLQELLPDSRTVLKNSWNTGKNSPGQYTAHMEVYKGETMLSESSSTFEVTAEAEGIPGVSGTLAVKKKSIYRGDDVNLAYTISNTGNTALEAVTARLRIVEAATGNVLDTITEQVGLNISESRSGEKIWVHSPLNTGNYMVVFDALFADGTVTALANGYFTVEKPSVLQSEAFKNTLFSGSTGDALCMYLYSTDIQGDIRTNKAFEFSGTNLTVSGILSSFGTITTWGGKVQIGQKKTEPVVVEMPDAVAEIREIAASDGNIHKNGLMITDYGKGIKLCKSEISDESIQINGTSLESDGYIVANESVSFNLNTFASTAPEGIVICSADSDISINASTANIKGIIYAPNGTVYINTSTFNLEGKIIARRIVINCSSFKAAAYEGAMDLLDVTLSKKQEDN